MIFYDFIRMIVQFIEQKTSAGRSAQAYISVGNF